MLTLIVASLELGKDQKCDTFDRLRIAHMPRCLGLSQAHRELARVNSIAEGVPNS